MSFDVTVFSESTLDQVEFSYDWNDPFAHWCGGELDITDYDLMGRCLDTLRFVWEKSRHRDDLASTMKGPYEFVCGVLDDNPGVLLSVDAIPILEGSRSLRVRVFACGTSPSVVYDVVEIEGT